MKLILALGFIYAVAYASPLNKTADYCIENKCKIEDNCRCSSTVNPIGKDGPQLIAITVSESVVATSYATFEPLLFERKNPDGAPIGLSFFVNHEYTDYELVHKLWARGYEIGSHSITKNSSQTYWKTATLNDLIEEFKGQKTILNTFGKIPENDIIGVRTPQLALEGDVSINAYEKAGFVYDNSWATLNSQRYFPFTLDYRSTQYCPTNCPVESHPGFWIVPITDIKGAENIECNSLATCNVDGSADDIANWLLDQVNSFRSGNRAPMVLRLDTYWFAFIQNSYDGFAKFLDKLQGLEDVFLVTTKQIMDFVKNPVPLDKFKTETFDRTNSCQKPIVCKLQNEAGSERIMKSCVSCPAVYPWKGNPKGE